MKYYRICQKILGTHVFSKLVETLLNGIINKFGKEISIEQFVKILEINIDAVIMLGLSMIAPSEKSKVLEQLEISIPYLVSETLTDFEEDMNYYIKLIAKNLS